MKLSSPTPAKWKLVLAFAAIYLFWGTSYLAIRYAVETIPPLFMMGIRHLAAGTVLFVWSRARERERVEGSQWPPAIIAGALFFLGCHGLLAWAEQHVASGLAGLLFATMPFWVVLLAWIRPGGRAPGKRVIFGLLLGLGGISLLVSPAELAGSGTADFVSAAALVLAALSWAGGTVYLQRARRPTSLALATAMQLLAGGGMLVAAGLLAGEGARLGAGSVSLASLLSLGFLIVFGSLTAFTVYNWLLRVSTLARVSTTGYVTPVVAVFIGWGMGSEPVNLRVLLATGIIVTAVAIIVTQRARPAGLARQESAIQPGEGILTREV